MEKEKNERFHELFVKLVDASTQFYTFDHDAYIGYLTELALLLRTAKAVTEFYRSESHEQRGDGEVFCDWDTGCADYIAYQEQYISPTGAFIRVTVYMSNNEPPLSEIELYRVGMVMRNVACFVTRNRLIKAIETVGFYDEFGYPNFRSLMRVIEQHNLTGSLARYAAIHFNLRHFAVINHDIGRQLGDVVMRNYFEMVRTAAGRDGTVCRLGGDNFTALIPKENLESVLKLMRGVPVCYDRDLKQRVNVSACCGVFMIPEGFVWTGRGSIMDKILQASTLARRGDYGMVVFCDENMMKMRERMMMIQRTFPQALADEEFLVYFQPKVDIRSGKIVGAEALCRWFHDGVIVPPNEFIPVLEQTIDICKLDFYMLDMVCRSVRRWMDEGRMPVRISVNLSRKNLVDVDLLEHIMEIINKHDVPHEFIEIELTETTTDVEFRDLKRVATGLQQEGIYTSVDDFGMGYSSLNLIREIPWNVLKIDRCFLPEDDDSENSVTNLMYRHVVSMARDMGLECITEGVETIKQIEILSKNNCHIAQGFFFDKPLPIEEFEARLDRRFYEFSVRDM